jgi:Tfp pilus assembly pilus retraction ATPase PilT
MINVNEVIKIAKEKDASDIHLVCGLKPMLRISRELIEI